MHPNPADLRLVPALFRERAALLAALDEGGGPAGELAIRTRARPRPGEPVVVEVDCPGLPDRIYLHAEVVDSEHPGWVRVRFEEAERDKTEFLVAFATGVTGQLVPRRSKRYGLHVPVLWRPFGQLDLIVAVAENLSVGGVQLRTTRTAEIGTRVVLRLRAEVVGELVLTGRVLAAEPIVGGEARLRVQFSSPSRAQQRDVRRLLRAFAERGLVFAGRSVLDRGYN